jgi:hypothetical protein
VSPRRRNDRRLSERRAVAPGDASGVWSAGGDVTTGSEVVTGACETVIRFRGPLPAQA